MLFKSSSLSTLLLLLYTCSTATALSNLQHPSIDFNLLGGEISLFGQFDGLSFFNTNNASAFLNPQAPGNVGLFVRNSTSSAIFSAATLDGNVTQTIQLTNDSALLLGNFSHINGVAMLPPVVFNVSTGQIDSVWPQNLKRDLQQQGSVYSALVDGDNVYLGGDFVFNNSNAVAVYNIKTKSLLSTPFMGFGSNSVVNSIAKYSGDSNSAGSIVFGGAFDTLGFPELLMHNMTYNVSADNVTNSSLISAEQLVSLKYATFSSTNGASSNNDASLACPSNSNTWSLQDNNGGQWAVELPNAMKGLVPTKVRIYLPDDSTNGIKNFRIYTYPNNGIMNLTYVDPSTNELAYCDAWCPLMQANDLKKVVDSNKANQTSNSTIVSENSTVFIDILGSYSMYYVPGQNTRNLGYGSNYQEFALVNQIGIDKIGLTTLSWYGSKAELSGFELYQDQIRVYGNQTLNEPSCGSLSNAQTNRAQINSGNWQSVQLLNSGLTTKDYLVSVVQNGQSSLTLYPNISYAGVYSVLLYTPGCSLDGSCAKRSIVNATVINANGTTVSTQQIYQNNLDDKFDYLFYGHLNASTSSGQTQIRLDYVSPVDSSVQDPWMVADKAVLNIVLLDTYYTKNSTNSSSNSNKTALYILYMKLNGLFEYSLANFSTFSPALVTEVSGNTSYISKNNTFVGNSTMNVLSGNLSSISSVSQVLVNGNSLLLLGEFQSSNISLSNNNLISLLLLGYNTTLNEALATVLSLSKRDLQTILGFQFNNTITSMYPYASGTIILGQFSISGDVKNLAAGNATVQSASNMAYYDNGQLYSFGNSFYNVDFSQFTQIWLQGVQYFVFASDDGIYTTWDNSHKTWLNLSNLLNITGSLTFNDLQVVVGSSFVSMSTQGDGAAYFSNSTSVQPFGFKVTQGSILAAYYVNSSYSVIGGNFQTQPSSSNVALIQNNTLTPLYQGASWGNASTVSAFYVDQNSGTLFTGSNGSVTVGNAPITGLSIYSLRNKTLFPIQPPSLSSNNGTSISVNAIAFFEDSKQLLVGGLFDRAGSLDCGVVCIYDTVNTRWLNPQSGTNTYSLSGVVTDAKFIAPSVVLISGLLKFNGTATSFLTYNFASASFSLPPSSFSSAGISGQTVKKFIINDNDNAQLKSRMVAMGQNFVSAFNGSSWNRIDNAISYTNSSSLTDLKLVQLSAKNPNNTNQSYFNADKALILSGVFTLKDYGVTNVAIFDGASWTPFIFTLENSRIGLVEAMSFQDIYRLQSSDDIKNNEHFMSVGQVVGISLACALGSTAFLGLLYIIPLFLLLRETKKKEAMKKRISEDDMMNIVDPSDLLHEMDLQRNY